MYNLYFGYNYRSFYHKPIGLNPPKFSSQCIGKNTLATLMKEMCKKAGLEWKGTSQITQARLTCATRLFESNVDEQLIMHQTGHRSNAVWSYKQPTAEHDMMVSWLLQPQSPKREKMDKENEPLSLKNDAAGNQSHHCPTECVQADSGMKSALANKGVTMTFNFNFQ